VLEEGLCSKSTMSSSYSGLGMLFESAMAEGEALLVLRLLRFQPNMQELIPWAGRRLEQAITFLLTQRFCSLS
jgi:hypothetical protein